MLKSNATLSPEEFAQIRQLLNVHAGLWFSPELRPAVERRLRERLGALGLQTFGEYLKVLAEDLTELGDAVEACTVNETYAFRGTGQLQAFRKFILPRLASRERVVVWSAGCASGEEAYTLGALVLASALFPPERVHIFGTDISRRCIAAARRGVYSASSFRGDEAFPFERFFQLLPNGNRTVIDDLRSICHFRHANLMDTAVGGFIDVVFCRNVLIHMDEASRRRIIRGFYDRLSPGGYLVLGHSESLLKEDTPFAIEELPDEIVYKKPGITDAAPRRST